MKYIPLTVLWVVTGYKYSFTEYVASIVAALRYYTEWSSAEQVHFVAGMSFFSQTLAVLIGVSVVYLGLLRFAQKTHKLFPHARRRLVVGINPVVNPRR